MGVARKVVHAAVGWYAGVFFSFVGSLLVAWGLNAWAVFRRGVGIGFGTLAIAFWGIVIGVFVAGPITAVLAVRGRKERPPRDAGRAPKTTRRSIRLFLVLSLAAAVLAVGGLGVCIGLGSALCSGLPPHETLTRGDFRYVLPSPDGSRYAFVSGVLDYASVGLLERGVNTGSVTGSSSGLPAFEELGVVPKAIAWMPDSKRLLVVFRERATAARDRIGVFSLESELMEESFELPFPAADLGGIAVSPDGSSALVTSEPLTEPGRSYLYRVDLRNRRVEKLGAEFAGWPESPVYLDAHRAVVVDYSYGHSSLRLIDLDSSSTEVLTPTDLNVYELAGRAAGGGIVFSAFHSTTDPGVTTPEDFDDPVVALVDTEGGEVRELFEPGVTHALRMEPNGSSVVALAETCSGDCSGEEVWTMDLSRYLD